MNDEKDKEKEKGKENFLKKPEKLVKKPEKTPEQMDGETQNKKSEGATGTEASNSEEKGEFQPMELPPFEIVTGWV